MNFADTLKAKAEESGQKTIQGESVKPEKAQSKEGLAAALGARAKASKQAAPITAAPKSPKADRAKDLKGLADTLKDAKQTREDVRGAMVVEFPTAAVKAWSFSSLKKFENCQWAVKLAKVDKIRTESGEAAQRGNVVHDGCEDWVRSRTDELPADGRTKFDAFSTDFANLRDSFREGKVSLEENWGIRKDWSPCDWDDDELWGRAKLDAFLLENETSCRIIDYKTGQKFGNEMKHADQGLSYALHTMHRYPELDTFKVEFWYLDDGSKMIRTFNRRQLSMLLLRYHNRAKKMTTTTDFIPCANAHTCRFCEYGSNTNREGKAYGNGACGFDHYRGLDTDAA